MGLPALDTNRIGIYELLRVTEGERGTFLGQKPDRSIFS